MLTLRAAASLLSTCDTPEALRGLLTHLGFSGEPLPMSETLRASLQLNEECKSARIIPGAGALRACTLELHEGVSAAATVALLARQLVARAPHALWVVAAVQRAPAMVAIAVPSGAPGARVPMLTLDRGSIVDSDAETFVALAEASPRAGIDLVAHARWVVLLGREALNRRFYRVLERRVRALGDEATGGRNAADRAELALLCSSRLLFLAFLQAKGWLNGDGAFLQRSYDSCMEAGGGFHERVLRSLFFGTLNTPHAHRARAARAFGRIPFLNGGLFAPASAERGARAPVLSDEALGALLDEVLGRYRFTASEDRTTSFDAAVDPEMLGRAFESLMATRERRASGTFYTPSVLVGRVADGALAAALESRLPRGVRAAVVNLVANEPPNFGDQALVRTAIGSMTVLDAACGSGAFLVHALERLARWMILAGDARPADTIRRGLLAQSIFGVDRDPTAVWLCELRLWLAVAVECPETDPARVLPLPNLDRNIRVGDSLAAPHEVSVSGTARAGADRSGLRVAQLRGRYARASGRRKQGAARALDVAERDAALARAEQELLSLRERRRDIVAARRSRDLFGDRTGSAELGREAALLRLRAAALRRERRRLLGGGALPFRYDVHFADVFAHGGFSAVIGNPPWVRLHRIPPADRERLREHFAVLRHAAWIPGAAAGGAGGGFAGQADLASLFIERSLAVLRPGGVLGLLVPAKLWTALAGGGVRHLLQREACVLAVEDCTEAPEMFDAVTYPSVVIAARGAPANVATDGGEATFAVHRRGHVARWTSSGRRIAWDASAGSPWLLLPPEVRAAFDRVRDAGAALADCGFGRPLMGVKCGHNEAFLVEIRDGAHEGAHRSGTAPLGVRDATGREGLVEAALLRPVIRGEHVRAWRISRGAEHIVWTHDQAGVLRVLPPYAEGWLLPHRARLAARTDSRGAQPWWMLHRVDGAESRKARVIWADMARMPRAVWLQPGDPAVPLNTCYVLPSSTPADAQALAALLNSPLVGAWLRALAEPARGGYRRLFAWTTALLPLPGDWLRARAILAPLAVTAAASLDSSSDPSRDELLDAVLAAYRLRRRDVAALLEWHPDSGS